MERLAEGDAEEKDEENEPNADPPPGELLTAATATALPALDRGQRRHGV